MSNVIGGEFKISVPENTHIHCKKSSLFASGRCAFVSILKKLFDRNYTIQVCGRGGGYYCLTIYVHR